MLLVLQHGMPPGEIAARRQFVATEGLPWTIGWILWAFAGLFLILLFLVWYDSIGHKHWALLGAVFAAGGGLVDWVAQFIHLALAPGWAAAAAHDVAYAGLYASWDALFIMLSPGLANLLDALGGIVLVLASLQTPGFPRWLAWWGLAAWVFGLALAYAAFSGQYAWIQFTSAGLFGLFLPWILALEYRWLVAVNGIRA